MITRRKFIQSNLLGMALPLAGSDSFAAAARPVSGPAASQPGGEAGRDYWNDWPEYMTSQVNEARERRLAQLHAMRSQADVGARIERVRSTLWKLVGGPFEKTPLNPQITGTIDRGAYTVEKVVFESHPAIYVTANLYLPSGREGPFPAVLAPLGHTTNGKAYRNYAYVYQTLARKGYVVLAFDPFGQGERYQYLDLRTGKPLYGPTGEHSQAGRPMLLFGSTFAQYRAWDGIRALDYLLSRPEVDPDRVGLTGQSGGATMTMYLCALEPRIKVAVEVDGNSENLAGPSYAPPGAVADAEQNLIFSLPEGIDRGDLLLAFAPKPLLMIYTPIDRGATYSPTYIEGTKEVYQEVQTAYELMSAAEKVGLFATSLPHDYDYFSRQAAYRWFNRWLGQENRGTEEAEFDEAKSGELDCTTTGQVLTFLGGRTVVQLNSDQLNTANSPQITLSDTGAFRQSARETVRRLLVLPAEKTPLDSATLSSRSRKDVRMEEVVFRSEPSIRVTAWFLRPVQGSGPFPTVLHVTERGKEDAPEETGELVRLAHRGFAVCSVDLRGLGFSIPKPPAAGPVFYRGDDLQEDYAWASFTLGKPVLGQRVWDCLRCLDYLESRPDVDRTKIRALGEEGGAIALLLAAALDDRLSSLMLDSITATYRSLVESKSYSLALSWFLYGILKYFDLPDMVATLAPRPCWILNATSPEGMPLPESKLAAVYSRAFEVYRKGSAEGRLRFLVKSDHERPKIVDNWLKSA
ncbi:MAG TPA: acetylxylan esterase [Terriglobia bacterium]|nr:acetylxylan esterase [Terriglobia bacterium]